MKTNIEKLLNELDEMSVEQLNAVEKSLITLSKLVPLFSTSERAAEMMCVAAECAANIAAIHVNEMYSYEEHPESL